MINIVWKKLTKDAFLPKKNHPTDSGYDLYSPGDFFVPIGGNITIATNIAVQVYFDNKETAKRYLVTGKIDGCSGNASKKGIDILGGRWDQGYTGDIGVVLSNQGNAPITIRKGDKIAQIVFSLLPSISGEVVLKDGEDFKKETDRGEAGFGESS